MKKSLKNIPHFIFNIIFAKLMIRPVNLGKIEKVLLSAYTGLGHFVLKTVLIKKIEELYPDCIITIIAGNTFGTEFVLNRYPTIILKQDCNVINKIIFFLKLRKEKFDAIFLPIDASPKFLIRGSILAGIPVRIGHILDHESVPEYYYTVRVPVKDNKIRSEIDINLDLIQALYKNDFKRDYQPHIEINHNINFLKLHSLEKDTFICFQMGGANGLPTTKRWLEENFYNLIKKLLRTHPKLKIVTLGDVGDSVIVNKICEGIKSERLINLTGKTSLEETKCLINYCKLLICHDSGLLHVGNALRKNVIAIYGPSDPDFYAMKLSTCHIIRKNIDCSPCQGLYPGMFSYLTEEEANLKCPVPECMRMITVEKVYAKCVELLEN